MCQYALAKIGRHPLDSQLKHDAHAAFKRTGKPLGIAAATIAALVTATAITIWGYKKRSRQRQQLTASTIQTTQSSTSNTQNQSKLNQDLVDAAFCGKFNDIKQLLKNNADVNYVEDGRTPLEWAVYKTAWNWTEQEKAIKLLLKKATVQTIQKALKVANERDSENRYTQPIIDLLKERLQQLQETQK